jgi:putative Holliday junction resolvase
MATNILALDIGEKRIGVARANSIARIPEPIATLSNDNLFKEQFVKLLKEYDISTIVVGLPRNLKGDETAQTAYTKEFVARNLADYDVIWQDETLSSVSAESRPDRLQHGVDAAAACIILDDYLLDVS